MRADHMLDTPLWRHFAFQTKSSARCLSGGDCGGTRITL